MKFVVDSNIVHKVDLFAILIVCTEMKNIKYKNTDHQQMHKESFIINCNTVQCRPGPQTVHAIQKQHSTQSTAHLTQL
jgi:hypothetical protein